MRFIVFWAVILLIVVPHANSKLNDLRGHTLRRSLKKELAYVDSAQARGLGLTSSQVSLVNTAWAEIIAARYPRAVVAGSDRATVYRQLDTVYGTDGGTSGYACWVMAQETSYGDSKSSLLDTYFIKTK